MKCSDGSITVCGCLANSAQLNANQEQKPADRGKTDYQAARPIGNWLRGTPKPAWAYWLIGG
jgi:hypothetical protein